MIRLEPTDLDTNQNVEEEIIRTQNTDLDEETTGSAIYSELTGYEVPAPVIRSSWKVSRENVTVGENIGRGAFSQVAKGTVSDLEGSPGNTVVAVKMLKGNDLLSCVV